MLWRNAITAASINVLVLMQCTFPIRTYAGETDRVLIQRLLDEGWEDAATLKALLDVDPAVTEGLFRDPRRIDGPPLFPKP